MAINSMDEMFLNDLGDIYDAEHQFLEGQQKMLDAATAPNLRQMLTLHIAQTKEHIMNLEEVFSIMGQTAVRVPCAGARGLVTEAAKLIAETANAPQVRDYAIGGSAGKVEHYEILSYEGLIDAARALGNSNVVSLFQRNLDQEKATAALIKQSEPQLLQNALAVGANS